MTRNLALDQRGADVFMYGQRDSWQGINKTIGSVESEPTEHGAHRARRIQRTKHTEHRAYRAQGIQSTEYTEPKKGRTYGSTLSNSNVILPLLLYEIVPASPLICEFDIARLCVS